MYQTPKGQKIKDRKKGQMETKSNNCYPDYEKKIELKIKGIKDRPFLRLPSTAVK